jgi:molecular chaperone DnaJ
MSHKDYYTVLGVAEDADQGTIKKSYRALAKKYHPDRNKGDRKAEGRFKEVQEAYDVLGDPEKRKKYDQLRKGGFSGGFSFEDLFGGGEGRSGGFGGSIFDLFERAGMGGGRPQRGPKKGDDVRSEITIPFHTAAFGGKTSIRIPRSESCQDCGGSGAAAGGGSETCSECRGTGTAAQEQGQFSFSRPCPRCYGRGSIIRNPCGACGGRGVTSVSRTLEVSVPAGIEDGGKIRLRGEGEAGRLGGPPGDLILVIHVAPHPDFRRKGLDVESDVTVDMVDAALGTEREVPTLKGRVKLRIPAGVQPGARLRLKEQGIRDHRGRTGDHYVNVLVKVPKALTTRQRQLLEELRSEG